MKFTFIGPTIYLSVTSILSVSVLALLISMICLAVNGQVVNERPSPTLERPREIVSLLFDARLAAPELAVDTLLKLVESKKIIDVAWRREILEEAWRLSDDVKNPVQLYPVTIRGVALNNTEAYIVASAHMQKLDRLSLKGRIILQFMEIDRERTKQIVIETGRNLGLKPRNCSDDLIYNVREIYSAVGKAAKSLFTPKEISENQRALLLSSWLENIETPTQISPALEFLEQMQGSASERQILFSAFSRAISKNFHDDRSFTSAVSSDVRPDSTLAKLLSGEPDPQKIELTLAYRDFLTKNLRSKRCKDNEIIKEEGLPKYIESVNKLLADKPLTFDDITASEYESRSKFVDLMARSSSAQTLRDELFSLKGKVVNGKIVNEAGPEWESRVARFVENILVWKGMNAESDSQEFHIKANMFGALLESIDSSEIKRSVARKYLRFLSVSQIQKTSFVEWSMYVTQMLKTDSLLFVELAPELPNSTFHLLLALDKMLNKSNKVD